MATPPPSPPPLTPPPPPPSLQQPQPQPSTSAAPQQPQPQPSTSAAARRGEGRETEGGQRVFKCALCEREYAHRPSLARHMRRDHGREANIHRTPCPHCGARVGEGRAFQQHMLAVHPRAAAHGAGRDANNDLRFPALIGDDVDEPEPTGEEEMDAVIREYWPSIVTRHRVRRLVDIVNIRLWGEGRRGGDNHLVRRLDDARDHIWETLRGAWDNVTVRAKVNCSIGCLLVHRTTGEVRYFHSSENNASIFARPRLVSSINDLRDLYEDLAARDLDEEARQRRPNTSWTLRAITNLTFYVWKMDGVARVGCGTIEVPAWLLKNRFVMCMDKRNGVSYEDNLCFFRCLALFLDCQCSKSSCSCKQQDVTSRRVDALYARYREWTRGAREDGVEVRSDHDLPASSQAFRGVTFADLIGLEKTFGIRIMVLELDESGDSVIRWTSRRVKGRRLILNLLADKHFSLITDVDRFTRAYICPECSRRYRRRNRLMSHKCVKAEVERRIFPGGAFAAPATVFDDINELPGISIEKATYPFRISFDIECLLLRGSLPPVTSRVEFTSEHEPLSISYCSNIPGYTEPVCIVRHVGESVETLVDRFVEGIVECALTASEIMREKYRDELRAMTSLLERVGIQEDSTRYSRRRKPDSTESQRGENHKLRVRLCRTIEKFERWLDVVPVLGFNSQRYDLNVLKPALMRSLSSSDHDVRFVVKRQNAMTCIETSNLRFLDICNYIAPGFSYDMYVKAFGCQASKGFFPYEWMDSLDKLDYPQLPDREAFYSSLRGEGITEEDYALCSRVWRENNMKRFEEFLVWYNNLDVVPLLEAVDKQCAVYAAKGIDMLKDAISLPGLAVRWMFAETDASDRALASATVSTPAELFRKMRRHLPVRLIDEQNSYLYQLVKDNLVGGPSIVFHRYHERGETVLREHEYGREAKKCERIYGVDANSLYVYCLMRDMPTGAPQRVVRNEATQKYESAIVRGSKTAHGWLEWEARRRGIHIRHEHNGGEVKIGDRLLPVDGFHASSSTVFQFHGCFWHGHGCQDEADRRGNKSVSEMRGVSAEELFVATLEKDVYIRSLGYKLITIWECEWRAEVRCDPEKLRFLAILFRSLYPRHEPASFSRYIQQIKDGSFFGMVECDIIVPEELRSKFSEMAPIFKNVEVGRDQLGEGMKAQAGESGYLKRPTRMLIGSLRGDKILLASPLARWYLEQGLLITEIYQLIRYHPRDLFRRFGESVCDARRKGDVDPSKKILADTSKLIGNSCYGKTITNKDRHRNVEYIDGHDAASDSIGRRDFESLNQLTDDGFYETTFFKRQVRVDVPVHVGFFVLQYAKLRMLEFYYDFMDRFVDRRDFQYMEMDTDSAYMALSGKDLAAVIRPGMERQFWEEYGDWFPRPYCKDHKAAFIRAKTLKDENKREWQPASCCQAVLRHDTRTPGLFKVEFEGSGMVALNSKTYCCWRDEDDAVKYSSKGLSKKNNSFGKAHFLSVLTNKLSQSGTNRGFVLKDNKMFTYAQVRTGLTYLYAKRRVMSDGVSTSNLDI